MGFETAFFAGETVEVLRAVRQVDPFSGEEGEFNWNRDTPQVVAQFFEDKAPFVPILPNSSSSLVEGTDILSPEARDDSLLSFFPYRTDIREDDRVRVRSGRYARAQPYEIDTTDFYKNPFDGELVICIVTLLVREG